MKDDGLWMALGAVALVAGAGLVRRRGAQNQGYEWRAHGTITWDLGSTWTEDTFTFFTDSDDPDEAEAQAEEYLENQDWNEFCDQLVDLESRPAQIVISDLELIRQPRRSLRDLKDQDDE